MTARIANVNRMPDGTSIRACNLYVPVRVDACKIRPNSARWAWSGRWQSPLIRMADAILVVEDDAALREMMAQQLHLAGFAPATAPNGYEALALLRMGFRAEQRRDPDLADIPVIVMSARDAAGIDAAAVFHKPFSGQEMIDVVRALCAAFVRERPGA